MTQERVQKAVSTVVTQTAFTPAEKVEKAVSTVVTQAPFIPMMKAQKAVSTVAILRLQSIDSHKIVAYAVEQAIPEARVHKAVAYAVEQAVGVYNFTAPGFATGRPVLDAPRLRIPIPAAFTAPDLDTPPPEFGAPPLRQAHNFSVSEFATGNPILPIFGVLVLPEGFVAPWIRSGLRSSAETSTLSGASGAQPIGGPAKAKPKGAGAARSNFLKE